MTDFVENTVIEWEKSLERTPSHFIKVCFFPYIRNFNDDEFSPCHNIVALIVSSK